MVATQTDKESAPVKWGLIVASILGAVLLIASIWSLSRALNKSSSHGSVVPTSAAATMNTVLSQEEIERREYELAEQRAAPVIRTPVTPPQAVAPANRNNEEVILQREKMKANQLIVERLKQYIKDHPNRDNRDVEEQIKKRENQGAPIR